jgi:hypothetical protein
MDNRRREDEYRLRLIGLWRVPHFEETGPSKIEACGLKAPTSVSWQSLAPVEVAGNSPGSSELTNRPHDV